jgi:Flp pilus assembly pilin Flp
MKRESGATMTEYLLMVALVAVALVAAIVLFEGALTGSLQDTVNCMDSIGGGTAAECPNASTE